jgi:hypothetical protein
VLAGVVRQRDLRVQDDPLKLLGEAERGGEADRARFTLPLA